MDIAKLKQLYEGLKHKPVIQVGVFQGKAQRRDGLSNAELASIHEFGSPQHGLPPRSMLRVPLADHAVQIMQPFRDNAAMLLAINGPMKLWTLVGVAAEKVVLQAFDTGGFGKWAPLKNATIWRKLKGSLAKRASKFWNIKAGNVGSGILIDTGQLRRAFKSRVRMQF